MIITKRTGLSLAEGTEDIEETKETGSPGQAGG